MKIAVHIGGTDTERMLARQALTAGECEVRSIDGGSIGCLQGLFEERDGNLLAMTGTPLDIPDFSQIRDYRDAMRWLPQCNGAFAALYWDAANRKLVAVTDFLGFKPLYLRRGPGELRLSSDMRAMPGAPDPAGWGAFIALGHTIGDRTLIEGVERVRPATILVYDVAADRLEQEQYWRWPTPAGSRSSETADGDGLVEGLRHSVAEYAKYGDPGTVLLSGGFDSRLILFLLKEAALTPRATIVSHRDEFLDADGRLAAAIAGRAKLPYDRVFSSQHFFSSEAFLDYLVASDASTPSLYLFISQIAQFVGDSAVWEGVVPGYTLTVPHQPPGGFKAYLAQECKGRDAPIWRAAAVLFRRQAVEAMYEGFRTDLQAEMSKYADDGFGVSEFIVRNRMRNRTSINPYKVYENRVRAFTPGMTRAYWDIAGTLSYDARKQNRFYLDLFRRHFPAALAVPILSGNSLVRPSPWSVSFLYNRVLAVAARRAAMHPNVIRRFVPSGAFPFSYARSRFLDSPLLRAPDDPFLEPGAKIPDQELLGKAAERLLFHWRAWHWVQEGRLQEVLSPFLEPAATPSRS
ncbi:hypothetical protein [Rhodospirillaceae bacterium SYSU D60014]|uniref:hypothetical protein n=1 Tax=Virgifigura deserti TaxID=2268457 RepID=UPI000E66BA70